MRVRRRKGLVALTTFSGLAVVVLAAAQTVAVLRYEPSGRPATEDHGVAGVPAWLAATAGPPSWRSVDVYAGYGTWVDLYDIAPSARGSRGPAFSVDAVDEMLRQGVRTLFLQAARPDDPSTGPLTEPGRLGQILVRAHQAGIRVVGWYLPTLSDIERDLARLQAIADFAVLGHRFDGIAVDIEATDVADPAERSARLVDLSERLRADLGQQAIGAIVLPPVQLEVVNPGRWPGFPWEALSGLYDVWLPMGYWTERTPESGYRDSLVYTEENVCRLRDDLGDPHALVHPIGGIGDRVTSGPAAQFARAAEEVDAIGASIYDWSTLDRRVHAVMAPRINAWPAH